MSEQFFWDSTLNEVIRAIEAKKRQQQREQKERAYFDYTLALAIGQSVARLYSSENEMPTIDTFYPSLFDKEEVQQEKEKQQAEISMIRFKQFAKNLQQAKGGYKKE